MTEIEHLKDLLRKGVSPVQTVSACARRLEEAGFDRISYEDKWDLTAGGKYYMIHHDTTLFAFTVGKSWAVSKAPGVRIAAAHTDYPCFRIKPSCDITKGGYSQVNIEGYGGAILSTWLDRPLGAAGRVALSSDNPFEPKIVEFVSDRSLFTIPNLAIHMNREVNKGVELNKQTDMLPIASLVPEEMKRTDHFLTFLAKELGAAKEEILDFELSVFCNEEPEEVGLFGELLSSPRLDNLNSCSALVSAIIDGHREEGVNLIALFDHEEVGSRSKQGAGSILLHDMLSRILRAVGREDTLDSDIYQSMFISADVAHGLHPNYENKMDITNKPVMGRGFCIKEASSQSYATDCEAIAIIEQICKAADIPYQKFVNRSDIAGGGTLGAIASTLMPVKTVDVGIPILAMHSARELMASADEQSLKDMLERYFTI